MVVKRKPPAAKSAPDANSSSAPVLLAGGLSAALVTLACAFGATRAVGELPQPGSDAATEPSCNMRTLDLRALGSLQALAEHLTHEQHEPVLIRHAFAPSSDFAEKHGEVEVEVLDMTEGEGGGFDWVASASTPMDHRYYLTGQRRSVRSLRMRVADYAKAMRNGSATRESYCFDDVRESTLLGEASEVGAFSELNDRLLLLRHAPAHWSGELLHEALWAGELRGALRGSAFLAMGVDESGGAFHQHLDALVVQLVGAKRWYISKHGRFHPPLTDDEVNHGLAAQIAAKLTPDDYWTCVQAAGELMWIPEGLVHTVLNMGGESSGAGFSAGISLQDAVLPTYDPLMRAARNGRADAIRWLLGKGGMAFDGARETALDESTPLHVAARFGHAEAARTLRELHVPIKAVDSNGRTALQWAEELGFEDVASVLR